MKLRYLLDTNVISEATKPNPSPQVLAKLNALSEQCAMASTTYHELAFGTMRLPHSHRKSRLEAYLRSLKLPILPYDQQAADLHAKLRVDLAAAGLSPSFVDGQIASVGLANGLTVVTRNIANFQNYPHLALENWFQPDF